MDGADIEHFAHTVLHTLPEDFPCPANIDLIEPRTGSGCDRDYTRAVNHAGAAVCPCEEVCQRAFIAHITDVGVDLLRKQIDIGVIMQHKRMHLRLAAY